MVHGPQCICEICTCGRHQCPHEHRTAQQALPLGTGDAHFYRKEFATVGAGAERPKPARPKGELGLGQGPFAQRDSNNAAALSAPDVRNDRFITSAALRKRTQNSQINLGGGGTGGEMRSTYREESERALLNGVGGRGARAVRPQDESREALFGTRVQFTPSTTVHQREFGAKQADRQQPTRPKTSELWKREGQFEGTTVSRAEYAEKDAERVKPLRPRENAPLIAGDGQFQRKTSSLSDFGPKRAERTEAIRPADSDLFKGGGALERETVNRSEYGRGGARGERFDRRVPQEEGASLLRGDGTFTTETSKAADFRGAKGERFEAKPHGSSDIWKNGDAPVHRQSVNREEYGQRGRGERFPAARPKDSGILRGDGTFVSETHKRVEFGPKKGERMEPKRQTESDIWKREGLAGGETVTRSEFKGGRGERFEARRPQDAGILRGDGIMESESVARREFGEKGRGERFAAKRHGTDEMWKREGTMADGGTVNREEYAIVGKRGERHEMPDRHRSTALFDPDVDPNDPPLMSTVHRAEFVPRDAGERAERKVHQEEGAELLRGDGSFVSETSKAVDFRGVKGERVEAKPHGSSDIWKTEDKMEGRSVNREEYSIEGKRGERHDAKRQGASDIWRSEGEMARSTVNRDDYSHTRGERAPQQRPVESNILKGEGSFASETHKRAEFGPKKTERVETKRRPADSDLFRREGTMAEGGTVNRSDYGHQQRGERMERRVPPESGILVPPEGALFEDSTVARSEFGEKRGDPVQRHRQPANQFQLDGGPVDYTTVHREHYAEKQVTRSPDQRRRMANDESNFTLQDLERGEWSTLTQEDFGPKEGERVQPVVHHSQFSLTEPGATFDTGTHYSEQFHHLPDSTYGERSVLVRPPTSLNLSGERELASGYRTDFQNKAVPCPAGELLESVKKEHTNRHTMEDCDHTDTEHFQFHAVSKGHHLYTSKENLTDET